MTPVLLLVDFQNDFLQAAGLEPHPASVIAATAELLALCRIAGVPVVHVWSTYDKSADNRMPHWREGGRDYWACVRGSAGHESPASLQPREAEPVVHKTFFSAFSTGQLDDVLRKLKADLLIVAGVHLHGCVRATALDAYARGYRVIVAKDCVASNDPLHAAITRRYLDERCMRFHNANRISAALRDASALDGLLGHEEQAQLAHRSPQSPEIGWPVTQATETEVASALATSRKAFESWRQTRVEERLKCLEAFRDQLQSHNAELVRLLIEDIGKPLRYARAEINYALSLISAACKQAETEQNIIPKKTGYRREPMGAVALISPFNNPLAIPAGKIAPALLYGNTVIWKPAIPGSRVALKTAELWTAATNCQEVLQVLCGDEKTARCLIEGSDAVTISGSREAGRSVQEICATRHIPLQAELGGNNASIVWHDANLPSAAASIAEGAFAFAGQRCTANRRVVVDANIYERFLEELISACSRLVLGDPADEQTNIGPLISVRACQRVRDVIECARQSSYRVITPVQNPGSLRSDAWVEPAIVCCDDPNAEVVQEETFGPVLVVQRANDWDRAITLCNGVKQGLVAALFSSSAEKIEDFLRRARTGVLKINSSTAGVEAELPFGGWKASGIGPPEHGPADREFFTRMQAIYFA